MKSNIIFSALLLVSLSACAHKQIKPEIILSKPVTPPDLPVSLSERAKPLPPITSNDMGTLAEDSANTSILYNGLSIRYNRFIDFYNCIKTSLETKSTDKCF